MKFLILLLLVSLVEPYVPLKNQWDQNFKDEQFLSGQGRNDMEEGSGENIDEILVSENSTFPATSSEFSTTTTPFTTAPPYPINCYDISKRCSKIKPLCTRNEYKHIMMRQCAKTCNLCPQFVRLPQTARCRDSFHSCPIWARNGFCHSTYYTLDERKEYCRMSCRAC